MRSRHTPERQPPYPTSIDRIRKDEYPTLKRIACSNLEQALTKRETDLCSADLKSHLFGNPHSNSPSSSLSTGRIEAARTSLLHFFKADTERFELIFVANATAAIKHVIGCFKDYCQADQSKLWYGYHRDSHTSLVGPREIASQVTYFQSDAEVENWLEGSNDIAKFDDTDSVGLFAFPGQSNLTGRRLSSSWPGRLRSSSYKLHRRVYSLLDAAALASTTQIDFTDHEAAPDFTSISLYKIFGFPDLGVLIIRKASGILLSKRRYFGGGTVDMIVNSTTAREDWVARKAHVTERNEDGTLPFHNIIALKSAMAVHSRLYGIMANISIYTSQLVGHLYQQMEFMKHSNGVKLCTIYTGGDPGYGDGKRQGPIVAFNLSDCTGNWIRKSDVGAARDFKWHPATNWRRL